MENTAKSTNKPVLIVHEAAPDSPLGKSVWALMAGHEIRFLSTKTTEELHKEAPGAALIILSAFSPGDESCQIATLLAANPAVTADLMGFAPNASVEERIKFLTYGFDYAFNDEFMKFPDFRKVILKKLEKGRMRLDSRVQNEEYRRFRASLSASSDAFLILDENNKIFFVSQHYKRAYPRSENLLIRGLDITDAFEALAQEQGILSHETRYHELKYFWNNLEGTQEFETADGRIWRMKASKLDDGQGTIITTTDITLYKIQKQELEKASAELNDSLHNEKEASLLQKQFVNMVSHEFRTPLTIIDGHAQLLHRKATEVSPDDIRKRAKTIRSAVSRLVTMMEGVLSSNMLKTGNLEIIPEQIDLRSFARDLCDDHSELSRGHKITLDCAGLPGLVNVDRKITSLILTNLLSNAIKYTKDNPQIILSLDAKDNWLKISVKDNGIGVPYDELPRIFERYFRASTATGIPGTGIGLSLVKDLVALYQGKIEVNSEIGQGTEFTVNLPLAGVLHAYH